MHLQMSLAQPLPIASERGGRGGKVVRNAHGWHGRTCAIGDSNIMNLLYKCLKWHGLTPYI